MLQTTPTVAHSKDISLVLSYAPLGLVRALSAQIGRDSILVDTGCVVLADNSDVEIVLSIRHGDNHMTHRIRARVVSSADKGVKLDFQECDKATLQALLPYITLH